MFSVISIFFFDKTCSALYSYEIFD